MNYKIQYESSDSPFLLFFSFRSSERQLRPNSKDKESTLTPSDSKISRHTYVYPSTFSALLNSSCLREKFPLFNSDEQCKLVIPSFDQHAWKVKSEEITERTRKHQRRTFLLSLRCQTRTYSRSVSSLPADRTPNVPATDTFFFLHRM